jgi:hypothetical protein
MTVTRILVCSSDLILGASVKQMLNGEANFQVVGLASEARPDIQSALDSFHPDGVILSEHLFLERAELFQSLVSGCSGPWLMVLSPTHSWLTVLKPSKILLSAGSDLLICIRSLVKEE